MKKEIKKLQRLREFFRSNQNNPDVKDKSKLEHGRKVIENEMERFREREKEFKMKQYSKKGLKANMDKQSYIDKSKVLSDGSYGSMNSDSDMSDFSNDDSVEENSYGRENDEISDGDSAQLTKDKEWLDNFITEKLKK